LDGEGQIKQPGLHERHRDKNGEISRKHGNALIGTLRKTYDRSFAGLNEHSLSQLVRDHEAGRLEEICKKQ
jgi:hypothetical protein